MSETTLFGYRVRVQVWLPHESGFGNSWVDVPDGIKLDSLRAEAIVNIDALLDVIAPPCSCCGTKIEETRKR